MENKKTVFETLASINVNEKIEKKNGLTYLSWAFAWGEVKKNYPDATYKVVRDPATQSPYFFDISLGYMVMTEVTIQGKTLEMWLPVMDGANKSMMHESYTYQTKYGEKTVDKATMFDINKTLMRCLTKNLAMFGLGHYIYAGEDLPETETAAPVEAKPETKAELETLKKGTENWDKVVKYVTANKELGVDKIGQQLSRKYSISPAIKKEIVNIINQK